MTGFEACRLSLAMLVATSVACEREDDDTGAARLSSTAICRSREERSSRGKALSWLFRDRTFFSRRDESALRTSKSLLSTKPIICRRPRAAVKNAFGRLRRGYRGGNPLAFAERLQTPSTHDHESLEILSSLLGRHQGDLLEDT